MTNNRYQAWSALLVVAALLSPAAVWAVTQTDVDAMEKHCFAARKSAGAIRAGRPRPVSSSNCAAWNTASVTTTYGNVSPGPTGAPQYGLFWDLPEAGTGSRRGRRWNRRDPSLTQPKMVSPREPGGGAR